MNKFFLLLCLNALLLVPINVDAVNLSPYSFGLSEAKNGTDVYYSLLRTHKEAIARGCGVSYSGIKELVLDIPENPESIPLPDCVDFNNVRFVVRNLSKNFFLFSLIQETSPISLPEECFSGRDIIGVEPFREGTILLCIEDSKPWVERRRGYEYGATRKDIVIFKNGKPMNSVVYPYNTSSSRPVMRYCSVNPRKKTIKNLTFERTPDSKRITFLFLFQNQYNIVLRNVKVITPPSSLTEDCVISIRDCARVLLKDVVIDGTYSAINKYGYGISLNNVWNSRFVRLMGKGKWGIFGNNNVSYARIEDCDINRFDIHCYGRDVYCKNTTFRDHYNQFSSFWGELSFVKCVFTSFVPVLFEPSYSAYTPFDLLFQDCTISVDKGRPYLVDVGTPSNISNVSRPELESVFWPNISVKNLIVNMPDDRVEWSLFMIHGDEPSNIKGLSYIKIHGLQIKTKGKKPLFKWANKPFKTIGPISVSITSSNIKERTIEFHNEE